MGPEHSEVCIRMKVDAGDDLLYALPNNVSENILRSPALVDLKVDPILSEYVGAPRLEKSESKILRNGKDCHQCAITARMRQLLVCP